MAQDSMVQLADILGIANVPMLWIRVLGVMGVVLLQSLIYMFAVKKNAAATDMSEEELRQALLAGAISARCSSRNAGMRNSVKMPHKAELKTTQNRGKVNQQTRVLKRMSGSKPSGWWLQPRLPCMKATPSLPRSDGRRPMARLAAQGFSRQPVRKIHQTATRQARRKPSVATMLMTMLTSARP